MITKKMEPMRTDYHSHVLPCIDDGAQSTDIAIAMLRLLREQGVARVVATPHCKPHVEQTVEGFLQKRQRSVNALLQQGELPVELFLGAEVAVERGLSEWKHLEQLCITGTKYILLEFPYTGFAPWMLEEVENIRCGCHLVPIYAHIHRCLPICTKAQMEELLDLPGVFQFNIESFSDWKSSRVLRKLIRKNARIVFGSDCHNLEDRRPNFDKLAEKSLYYQRVAQGSDSVLCDAYRR